MPRGRKANRATGEPETIQGEIEKVFFYDEARGHTIARLYVPSRREGITIVGPMPRVVAGETWQLTGAWTQHVKYGLQFAVQTGQPILPTTEKGIEKYLASMIPGVGPAVAARIVQTFGANTITVIDETPDRLKEVPLLGANKRKRILEAWREQQDVRSTLVALEGMGISPAYAMRILKTYGTSSVTVVQTNPYQLCEDVEGVAFITADKIAAAVGIPKDSPFRARAGLLHVLKEANGEGHVYLPKTDLGRRAVKFCNIPEERHAQALQELVAAEHVVIDRHSEDEYVYLSGLHRAEVSLARRLIGLLQVPAPRPRLHFRRAIEAVEREMGFALSAEQQEAIRLALTNKVLVITGGPGTGKTTLLCALVRLLQFERMEFALAAPTGRAAKRLAEVTGEKAATIHRLLGFQPERGRFTHSEAEPLDVDAVIVDEVSMCDTWLASVMVSALPLTASLIFVGDVDQLPSVGPGAVLRDLLDSAVVPAVRLTTIYRQSEASRIVQNAHAVRNGTMPSLVRIDYSDFLFLERADPQEIQDTVVHLVQHDLPRQCEIDPLHDIQVLTPMHRGLLGTAAMNHALQEALNPHAWDKPELARGTQTFRVGDRVMQMRNNYSLGASGVFNGDVGIIRAIDKEDGVIHVHMDDETIRYEGQALDDLGLSYCCSIHKSQGSETRVVLTILHSSHYVMLMRNLFYTALTRARDLAIVVGTEEAIRIAVQRENTSQRYSGLLDRLQRALRPSHVLPHP